EVLSQFDAYKNLKSFHRKSIRADLETIDRLIQGGYNPWAVYNLHKKIANWTRGGIPKNSLPVLLGKIWGYQYVDLELQPLEELRLSAIKAYIVYRGYNTTDLSELTNQDH